MPCGTKSKRKGRGRKRKQQQEIELSKGMLLPFCPLLNLVSSDILDYEKKVSYLS